MEEMETADTELKGSLLYFLKQQRLIQTKVTDLEGRSCSKNIRMNGIKEGTEESSMITFIDNFLKITLALEIYRNSNLQIQ